MLIPIGCAGFGLTSYDVRNPLLAGAYIHTDERIVRVYTNSDTAVSMVVFVNVDGPVPARGSDQPTNFSASHALRTSKHQHIRLHRGTGSRGRLTGSQRGCRATRARSCSAGTSAR
jgi:hypothetical protein